MKGTWEQYKRETNNPLATRVRFKDSVDFIGWYIHKLINLRFLKKMLINNTWPITKVGVTIKLF